MRFLAEVNSTSVRDLIGAADCNGDSRAYYALFDASTLSTATWNLNNNVYVSGLFGRLFGPGRAWWLPDEPRITHRFARTLGL